MRPVGMPKTGGRKKGSKNKITPLSRERINDFLGKEFEDMCATYKGLKPKEKVDVYIALMKYVLPPAKDLESGLGVSRVEIVERLFSRREKTD